MIVLFLEADYGYRGEYKSSIDKWTICLITGETLEELKFDITDAIKLILVSIYEEAYEKKKK